MTDPVTFTTNLKLAKVPANGFNWAALMNNNLAAIDAAISSYFVIQQYAGPWTNSTPYIAGDVVLDTVGGGLWQAGIPHTSAVAPTTFAQDKAANPTYWAAYSSSGVGRGVWLPQTAYRNGDFVVSGNQYAVCIVSHVSSNSFADDLAAGKWAVLVDFSLVGTQPLPILGGIADANKFAVSNAAGTGWTIYNAADARAVLGAHTVGDAVFTAGSVSSALTALGAGVVGQGLFVSATVDQALNALAAGATGKQLLAATNATEAQAIIGMTFGNVGLGMITDEVPGTVTAGYLQCNGQAVSRVTYASLFAKIGTTFGAGDGIGTFNLPNMPAQVVYNATTGDPVLMKKIIRMV